MTKDSPTIEALQAEIASLRAQRDLYETIFDSLPLLVGVYDVISRTEFRANVHNRAMLATTGAGADEHFHGKRLEEFLQPGEAAAVIGHFQNCLDSGKQVLGEQQITLPSGVMWFRYSYTPVRDKEGAVTHIIAITENVTASKQREQDAQLQAEIIEQQAATLAELSTPLLTISDSTVVMPLIGAVDSRRVQQIMEALLSGVASSSAQVAILDITGVPVVDTQVANAVIHAAQAVRLLGAQVVLTGIRPEVAQTLVGLGVDLRAITTRSSLQSGIAFANSQ
jgi:PAS domain S-box-containing protein